MNRGQIIITLIGVLFDIGYTIGSGSVVATAEDNQEKDVACLTPICVDTAATILKDLNPVVEPCDNFYEFACGGYLASTPIPDGEVSVDRFTSLETDIENQLKLLIEEPSSPNEARPFKLARTLYKTCMNMSAIEKRSLEPLREILREFGNWPVIEGDDWKENAFNWVESVYKSRKLGYSFNNFIGFDIDIDCRNKTNYILALDQAEFGLSRAFLIEGAENSFVKAYYDYMVDIAVLLGANKQRASEELKETLDFEIELANIASPEEERRNFTLFYNPMTITELTQKCPIVNWEEYINKLLPLSTQVDADDVVTVKEPNYIREFGKLLKNTPKRVQANYAVWRVVAESVKYLNNDLRRLEMKYNSAITDNIKTISDPRWKQCLGILSDSSFSLLTSALYVRKYSKENERQNVIEMVTDIRNQLMKSLEKADWMDEETRIRAIEKSLSMTTLVGYPIELLDDNVLEKFFATLTLKPDDLLENYLQLRQLKFKYSFELLRKPVNKTDWIIYDFSTEVDDLYGLAENSIRISTGILRGMFFSNDRPRYLDYGAIGFLIGHEILHGFDNEGREFDKDGNLVDWWTLQTAEEYLKRTQCFVDQYNNYTVESVDEKVNGVITLVEDIADNGGVKNAYLAYKEYVKRNGPEPKLPGLKYTPEQMFWISAANIRCSRHRPESEQSELNTTDNRSPAKFRVIGPFANSPEFAADYNCPVGSQMNPANKCTAF